MTNSMTYIFQISNQDGIGDANKITALIALFIIALGSGGIKPCVSSLGGDQFQGHSNSYMITKFFALFYASINAGSLLSYFITPFLREGNVFTSG